MVDRFGAPECCYTLVSGKDQLTFTYHEVAALAEMHGFGVESFQVDPRTGMLLWAGDQTEAQHRELLHAGWMADTLECSSHPLRPIVGANLNVIGTVAVDACNTPLRLEYYREHRDEIASLWQLTVDLFGVKNYYVTYNIKAEWIVL